jgi:hypothetical protein
MGRLAPQRLHQREPIAGLGLGIASSLTAQARR